MARNKMDFPKLNFQDAVDAVTALKKLEELDLLKPTYKQIVRRAICRKFELELKAIEKQFTNNPARPA